ncbi:hypothetical protein RB595_001644 [Gaeumannomyces hyphopodioides]
MSFVEDRVRLLDSQIDRICLTPQAVHDQDQDPEAFADGNLEAGEGTGEGGNAAPFNAAVLSSPRVAESLRIVKTLSTTATSHPLLGADRIRSLILRSGLVHTDAGLDEFQAKSPQETEIDWLLISKATLQVYGLMFNTLLDQIIPLSNDIWYWDEVLSSYTYSSLYTIQTSPVRLWDWTKDVASESKIRLRRMQRSPMAIFEAGGPQTSTSARWARFYGVVRESIAERSLSNVQRSILSPISLCRAQAKQKQGQLKRLRDMMACGLGVLIDEALSFGAEHEAKGAIGSTENTNREWRGFVERSVVLMDLIVKEVLVADAGTTELENRVFRGIEMDPELSVHAEDVAGIHKPSVLARRLMAILDTSLPDHVAATGQIVQENGRPSKAVRYWLPATVLLLSSSTVLRILVRRQQDILQWVADLGTTTTDFWFNWVVEPVRKIIGTIRHDNSSEIAIMSRDSLRADRESLERMVVEFALERPELAVGKGSSALTDGQVAEIRAKVREGDVTTVLRAYEKELKKPLVGAVRGDLVRSLLIQVQKTKVDLETAISGIDALLKSQELVFGFVGLTPGVLVSVAVFQYLRTLMGGRRGLRRGERAVKAIRVLRNMDRILADAVANPSNDNLLSYKEYGLLVCEVHMLRKLVRGMMPADIEKEFLQDLDDVANVKGITAQIRALDRIRWAYSRWLR